MATISICSFLALITTSHSFLIPATLDRGRLVGSFPQCSPSFPVKTAAIVNNYFPSLKLAAESDSESPLGGDDDDEEVEPGMMRVSEIKAELDMRGVPYTDCFDKESLELRLLEARVSGAANPELIDKFNKQRLEDNFEGRAPVDEALSDDTLLNQAVGNDGKLPGGLSPDQFKELIENPEVMALLQSTKMQEVMKLVMTGEQEKVEEAIKDDPELRDMVGKLQSVLGGQQ